MHYVKKIGASIMYISEKNYLLIFAAFFFVMNVFMPICYDDYAYAFIWDGEHGGNLDGIKQVEEYNQRERVESIIDIVKSQHSHWYTWGGAERSTLPCTAVYLDWQNLF